VYYKEIIKNMYFFIFAFQALRLWRTVWHDRKWSTRWCISMYWDSNGPRLCALQGGVWEEANARWSSSMLTVVRSVKRHLPIRAFTFWSVPKAWPFFPCENIHSNCIIQINFLPGELVTGALHQGAALNNWIKHICLKLTYLLQEKLHLLEHKYWELIWMYFLLQVRETFPLKTPNPLSLEP